MMTLTMLRNNLFAKKKFRDGHFCVIALSMFRFAARLAHIPDSVRFAGDTFQFRFTLVGPRYESKSEVAPKGIESHRNSFIVFISS